MKSFFRTTTRVRGPERIFEELEPRIVLDASIDASGHDHSLGNHDLHGLFTQAVMDDGSTDHHAAAMTADGADQDFNVVLISNALPELDMLTRAASEHAQVVIFDSAKDNLDTINVRLHDMVESSGNRIDHLAVLDHAKAGQWRIGTDRFDLFSLPSRRSSFEALGSTLSDAGQIQLYGCSLAGDPMGQALVDRMALYTHADVFASFHKIGGSAHSQDNGPSAESATSMTQSQPAVEAPASTDTPVDGPVVDAPQSPIIMNLGSTRFLNLGNSFTISDSNPESHVAATVTYNPQPDLSAGISELKLKNTASSHATVTEPSSDSTTWAISGSVADVNKVLSSMRATTDPHYKGEAQVEVAVVDPVSHAPVSSETLTMSFATTAPAEQATQAVASPVASNAAPPVNTSTFSDSIPFMFQPLQPDDPPVIVIDTEAMKVDGYHTQPIPEIQVYDPGSRFVDVVLSANHGGLSVPNPLQHAGVEVRGNNGVNERVIRLSGFFNDLNDTLKHVTYKPNPGYAGPDDLSIYLHSRGNHNGSALFVPVVEKTLPIEVSQNN